MTNNRKYLLEKFEEHLIVKYKKYCKNRNCTPSEKVFLTYLIDHDLIPPIVVKRFAVKEEYGQIADDRHFSKRQTMQAISDLFNIPESTVRGILKKP